MGIVVDEEEAEQSVCTCYKIEEGNSPEDLLCFVDGVVGALSNSEDRSFCEDRIVKGESEEYSEHVSAFKEWSEVADKCMEEDVDWACVEREAEKRQ